VQLAEGLRCADWRMPQLIDIAFELLFDHRKVIFVGRQIIVQQFTLSGPNFRSHFVQGVTSFAHRRN
jgi:hypothetical protein